MRRTLRPELLDSLPPEDPAARHNRRDLQLTNAVLGNHRWLVRTLARHTRAGETTLELGAGTGELGIRLAAVGIAVDGLDLWPRPPAWPGIQAWLRADLRTFDGYQKYPVIFGNLILHQFSDQELAALGLRLRAHARLVVAAEPARRRISQALFRTIAPLLGANHVSLHDAHVSIAAGFRRDELPQLLGLEPRDWDIRCQSTWLGMNRMIAIRRE